MTDRAESARSPHVVWHEPTLSRDQRWTATGGWGATVWLTGLSGSGKSTIANELIATLTHAGTRTYGLDADNLRHGLNADLGFDRASRDENVRRVSEVAALLADAGVVAIVPIISPYAAGRERARALHERAGLTFVEVHVDAPLAVCEERDPKGLYAKARAGELRGFTGVDDPYEVPDRPDLVVHTDVSAVTEAVADVVALLHRRGLPR